MLLSKKILISDIADLAGVSARTIRYYTEEGLLPQPEVDGKYAYYTQSHLTRLNLIKLLKDNFLPLKEIRLVLLGMTDDEIEAKVGDPASISSIQERAVTALKSAGESYGIKEVSSALDYISQVLGEQAPTRNRPEPTSHPRPTITGNPLPPRSLTIRDRNAEISPNLLQGEAEQWEKFILADGVELFIRQPSGRRTQQSVHQLLSLARKLFS